MKHIIFYSGGIGSWATAKRVIAKYGKENVVLLFTDTLIEDEDLYRFIDETVNEMDVEIVKISDGRTPFQVFEEKKFLGNSRFAPCSHDLKQVVAKKWVEENFKANECILYLGIDWTESHRRNAPRTNWLPYVVKFPMCVEPYVTKNEMLDELVKLNIEIPRLYKMGFSHNNCGGFCCRAGQGHFANLLKQMPNRYKEYEQKEKEVIEHIGKDVAMMVKQVNGIKRPYTLESLRKDIENNQTIDINDVGGCGCFVDTN